MSLDERISGCRILIVDDEEANVRLLERVLERGGYANVKALTDSRHVLAVYAQWQPDLVLMDLHMPHLDGFAVMEQLGLSAHEGTFMPLIVLTADVNNEVKQRALGMGAKDFLLKPFDHTEVLLRIRNLLHTRLLHLELADQNRMLEVRVRERTQELDEARTEIIERLALAAEYRDDDTHQHTWRVGQMSALLAKLLGLGDIDVELVRRAAPLHDVGKIGISDLILLKPGRLSDEEFEVMRSHTSIGAKILSGSAYAMLQLAAEIALTHHERWDGAGYPRGLAGGEIPTAGRIVTVADVFDALTHERPYKKAWPVADAMAEIQEQAGKQFDPGVVEVFSRLSPEAVGYMGADPDAIEELAPPLPVDLRSTPNI
jgi:putative two-component system response regulator